jgi:hypothetical protein
MAGIDKHAADVIARSLFLSCRWPMAKAGDRLY